MPARSYGLFRKRQRIPHSDIVPPQRRLTRKRDLLLAFAVISVPLPITAVLLMYYVFGYRVQYVSDSHFAANNASDGFPRGYYITEVHATKVLTISAWASTISQ